jgi:hypothetical protein
MRADLEHARVSGLLAAYAAGTLDEAEQALVAAHVTACARCQHDLQGWYAIRAATQDAAPILAPGRDVLAGIHLRIAAQQGDGPLSLTFLAHLLLAQVPLVRRQIWVASALVMSLGLAVIFVYRAGADAFLAMLAPIVAAAGIGFIYGYENDPPLEITLATPTSPRLVLLARLALVFGYDLLLALGLSALLAVSGQAPGDLQALILQWLGPMLLLSSISLALSLRLGSVAGVSVALVLWAMRLMLASASAANPLGAASGQVLALLSSTNLVTLALGIAILAAVVVWLPRREQFT